MMTWVPEEGRTMWRSYDMVDGSRDMEEPIENREVEMILSPCVDSRRSWLLPRLASFVETERSDRIVRIPPGFLSC